MTRSTGLETALDRTNLQLLVSAEAAGEIEADELALLEAAPDRWETMLHQLLTETEESLARVARSDRDERDQVLADLSEERDRLVDALRRVRGDESDGDVEAADDAVYAIDPANARVDTHTDDSVNGGAPSDQDDRDDRGNRNGRRGRRGRRNRREPHDVAPALQASWLDGHVVLWAGSASAPPSGQDVLHSLIGDAAAGAINWVPHRDVPLPSGGRATAVAAPLGAALGWLVGTGAGQLGTVAAPSTRWLGEVAVLATEMVAQGRMVPTLTATKSSKSKSSKRSRRSGDSSTAHYVVKWTAAVVDGRQLRSLASRMPGAVGVFAPATSPERVCRALLDAAVDAVCRAGAARLVAPAAVPVARSRRDVAEAVLAGLDGTPFMAARRPTTQLTHELGLWTAPVTGRHGVGLVVELHPPERDGGWLLSVSATGMASHPLRVDKALANASGKKSKSLEAELRRLERLLPALRRSGARDEVQVILDADEAWDLMTDTGAALVASGFTVRVPTVSRRRPAPRLQLWADRPPGVSRVGAHELSKVHWTVLFDDLELDAAEISRLASDARPLVQVKGRWIDLDKADLDAAAEVLAQHSATQELSGAAIVRYAVGLEDNRLGATVAVAGTGWAVDLVREATGTPPAPLGAPDGFVGELRPYQAEARGWLAFLDRAGLGGCLAMDMGLGKTPTLLAHLLETRSSGPTLVVAPPAVLGNWAAEAARFTPELRVHVHHGAARAAADEVAKVTADADVVLTTYATAVRDVEALAGVEWHRVVLDEAQAIKNPASDTAQQLRRLPGRSRLALTGTPVENSLGDLWSILDFTNPGLVGERATFMQQLSATSNGNGNGNGRAAASGEAALRALNGLLVFRRTKTEPEIAAELPDKIDELDHCGMTAEQVGIYQAILDDLLREGPDIDGGSSVRKGRVLAAITALKQVCDHPAAYLHDDKGPLEGRSGKLARLDELVDAVFAAGERMLVFTHFARWGERLAEYLSERTGVPIACYHGGLTRGVRDRMVKEFQAGTGRGALVLSIKAGGSGLNLTAASHVVLYDRWWNPAVEDQARDRAWRIGQTNTVISHRLVCPGTVDERVEEVVAGKRRIADLVLPASSSLGDLGADQLRTALGLREDAVIDVEETPSGQSGRRKGRAA